MSLIQCSECSRTISDKAKSCPHCGMPEPFEAKNEQSNTKVVSESVAKHKEKDVVDKAGIDLSTLKKKGETSHSKECPNCHHLSKLNIYSKRESLIIQCIEFSTSFIISYPIIYIAISVIMNGGNLALTMFALSSVSVINADGGVATFEEYQENQSRFALYMLIFFVAIVLKIAIKIFKRVSTEYKKVYLQCLNCNYVWTESSQEK